MSKPITIRNANVNDATEISGVAIRSKAHWGYSQEFMDDCEEELTVTPEEIGSPRLQYVIAERNTKIVGFYAISQLEYSEYELEALFVDSDQIGTGVGRTLMDHAKNTVREQGGKTLVLQSDPNAAKFYRAAGGKFIGERESGSIPGRFLPVFKIELASDIAS